MHLYELVCLDFDRSRTVILAHDHLIPSATFHDLLAAVEDNLLPPELPEFHERWKHGRRTLHDMAKALGADPAVLARLEVQTTTGRLTYSDVLDVVVGLLHEHGKFYPPPVQASVTRLGHAPLP